MPYTPLTPQGANILAAPNGGRLVTQEHDYIAIAYPDSDTEVYTYKKGGADSASRSIQLDEFGE